MVRLVSLSFFSFYLFSFCKKIWGEGVGKNGAIFFLFLIEVVIIHVRYSLAKFGIKLINKI